MCFLSMANNAAQEICQNKGQTSRLLFSVCTAEEGWDTLIGRTGNPVQLYDKSEVGLVDTWRFFLDSRDRRLCDVPLDGELLVDLSISLYGRHGALQTYD